MSGCCTAEPICIGGRTYFASIVRSATGTVMRAEYVDENLVTQTIAPGSFEFGACPGTDTPDVSRFVVPLLAGNTVVTHNLGSTAVEVEVRDNVTGATITARVVGETPTSVTLFVPVAVAAARISIDA